MTNEQKETFARNFAIWFQNDGLAVRACLDLLEVVHLWDDLIDQDKPIENADVAMRKAIIDLPSNPFWSQHIHTLTPVLQSVYLQWRAANVLEKSGSDADSTKAYMLKASLYQVFHYVAGLCGGIEWAEKIGPDIYRLYGEEPEGAKNA